MVDVGFAAGRMFEDRYVRFANTDRWYLALIRTAGAALVYLAGSGLRNIVLEPLAEPAFVALKTVGSERILLLGISDDACAGYLADGEQAGMESSALWAAETLANRLRHIKALAGHAAGIRAPGTLAERLERPLDGVERTAFPYENWKSTYDTESHVRW